MAEKQVLEQMGVGGVPNSLPLFSVLGCEGDGLLHIVPVVLYQALHLQIQTCRWTQGSKSSQKMWSG
jgi:hypothetical protein